ncbi:hypothetical protein [Methanobrevibacter sp.]|uniref:hypothetical protein n=1 Tax=Methanobrevibacter sp. TaxID=66852 RepID=UPI0038686C78
METDALVNGILSFVIPGLGQAIEGYKTRGLILFIIAIIIGALSIYFHLDKTIQYLISALYGLLAGYDAYRLY